MDYQKINFINEDEYFKSSVLIPFFIYNGEYHILLEKRSPTISQPGELCFPGGRFDKKLDRSTKDTAIRETFEELGIDPASILKTSYWGTYIAPMSTLIDVYIGFLDISDVYSLPINKSEVEKIIVIPFSYFLATPASVHKIDSWSYPYRRSPLDDKVTIFPAQELGLPVKYHTPWQGKSRSVYLYPTDDVPIWGVTADIIRKFVNKNIPIDNYFNEVE